MMSNPFSSAKHSTHNRAFQWKPVDHECITAKLLERRENENLSHCHLELQENYIKLSTEFAALKRRLAATKSKKNSKDEYLCYQLPEGRADAMRFKKFRARLRKNKVIIDQLRSEVTAKQLSLSSFVDQCKAQAAKLKQAATYQENSKAAAAKELTSTVAKFERETKTLSRSLQDKERQFVDLESRSVKQDERIKSLEDDLDTAERLEERVAELRDKLSEKERKIKEQSRSMETLRRELADKATEINMKDEQLQSAAGKIKTQSESINDQYDQIKQKERENREQTQAEMAAGRCPISWSH